MKRALVTGAAGFVGRHMVERLLADGWRVQTVDLKPLDIDYLDAGPLMSFAHEHWEGDVREWFFWERDPARYDLIVHCAAVIGGRATINGHPLSVADNLSIDTALFQWAVRTGQPRVVYYSSSAAYPIHLQCGFHSRPPGMDPTFRLTEEMIKDHASPPDAIYGWGKLTGELLASHARAAGVAVHVLRPFSGYGEDQDPAYPFRAFIERAKRREDPFRIWGTGRQVRDWVHIDDVIGATLAVVDADCQEPVNVCTGRGVSMRELAALILSQVQGAGYWPEVELQPDAPDGPCQYRVGDPTRMKTIYKPEIRLEEGIRRALAS